MGKVTILFVVVSTLILLITFGQGVGVLRGGDVASHLYWSFATLISVLATNFFTVFHATQSDRIIGALRNRVAELESQERPEVP